MFSWVATSKTGEGRSIDLAQPTRFPKCLKPSDSLVVDKQSIRLGMSARREGPARKPTPDIPSPLVILLGLTPDRLRGQQPRTSVMRV